MLNRHQPSLTADASILDNKTSILDNGTRVHPRPHHRHRFSATPRASILANGGRLGLEDYPGFFSSINFDADRTGETNMTDKLCFMKRLLLVEERFIKKAVRSEEHTSELQSRPHLVCRLLL